mmetsp:Transcript_45665/g.151407  ORF Transcript_45665/g.151407 Transcript_45665/m.151407 type:complete len:425 (+) Transcript_45665:305-1579(+)
MERCRVVGEAGPALLAWGQSRVEHLVHDLLLVLRHLGPQVVDVAHVLRYDHLAGREKVVPVTLVHPRADDRPRHLLPAVMPAVTVAEDARAPLALALDRRSHLQLHPPNLALLGDLASEEHASHLVVELAAAEGSALAELEDQQGIEARVHVVEVPREAAVDMEAVLTDPLNPQSLLDLLLQLGESIELPRGRHVVDDAHLGVEVGSLPELLEEMQRRRDGGAVGDEGADEVVLLVGDEHLPGALVAKGRAAALAKVDADHKGAADSAHLPLAQVAPTLEDAQKLLAHGPAARQREAKARTLLPPAARARGLDGIRLRPMHEQLGTRLNEFELLLRRVRAPSGVVRKLVDLGEPRLASGNVASDPALHRLSPELAHLLKQCGDALPRDDVQVELARVRPMHRVVLPEGPLRVNVKLVPQALDVA